MGVRVGRAVDAMNSSSTPADNYNLHTSHYAQLPNCFPAVMGDACMVERAMQLSEVQGAAGRPAASMPPARRAGSGGRGGHGQSAGGQHGGWGEVPYGDVVSMGGQLWYEAC